MNKEEFVKEQMKLSKEDIIANYWYTYQDNVERLGIEHQLELKDKEIERLNHEADTYMKIAVARRKRINKAIEYLDKNSFGLGYVEVAKLTDMLRGDKK